MNKDNSKNIYPSGILDIVAKLSVPVLIFLLIPGLLSEAVSNISGTYGQLIRGSFLFSGELFTIGPLNRLNRLMEDGNVLAIILANIIPVSLASFIIYATAAEKQEPKWVRIVISILWGVVITESIGAASGALLASLLSGITY